jgi:hypothetical protein
MQNLSSQTATKQITGSEKHIDLFNGYAEKIGIDDLRLTNDSLRIRIWDRGKLVDFKIIGDTIYVQKFIYMITNPSYKRNPKRRTIIYKKIESTNEQKELIEEKVRLICLNNPLERNIDISREPFYINNSGKINYDSISVQDFFPKAGGITNAIEFSNKENYFWTSWLPTYSEIGTTIASIMAVLEMKEEQSLFVEKLPNGAWYSYGDTVAWYKLSRWEGIYRGFYLKRIIQNIVH